MGLESGYKNIMKGLYCSLLVAVCLCCHAECRKLHASPGDKYLVGVGVSDITGPAADVNMMGYANAKQIVGGIYTRLWARAYIVADKDNKGNRFVFVNLDACMAAQSVTLGVISALKGTYGDLYTAANVALSGTHTHSGPGGYLQYVLYDITSLGFVRESYDALVNGIVQAIHAAHSNMAPGRLEVAMGDLVDAGINRSPSAYAANPEAERALYKYNTDKQMTLLKVLAEDERPRALLAWYATHGTSINNTNTLISGDNKGVAAQLTEKWAAQQLSRGAKDKFVAAFAQSNTGDVSPNVLGAFCQNTGMPCDYNSSTCGGRVQLCIGRGPAYDADDSGYSSNLIIATRQAEKAKELWASKSSLPLAGAVDSRHSYMYMPGYQVKESKYTRAGKTCTAAMGFSFAAGTTDGPGDFDFIQGDIKGNVFWEAVRNLVKEPSRESMACQAPKPILLDTGNINFPYPWQPSVVEVQVLRAGQLLILAVPGEFTTMAGRRLRAAVYDRVKDVWGKDVVAVIAGLTNTYSSYVTTFEEYQVQRYEGASTIFGPHTLDAYIQETLRLVDDMIAGRKSHPGQPEPPNLMSKQLSFLTPVVVDAGTLTKNIGDVLSDVTFMQPFQIGDRVSVTFQAACPRNNLRSGGSFLLVEMRDASNQFVKVADDNDISTRFIWTRTSTVWGQSEATIQWTIPPGTAPGVYRISYFGDRKPLIGRVSPVSGRSNLFRVSSSPSA